MPSVSLTQLPRMAPAHVLTAASAVAAQPARGRLLRVTRAGVAALLVLAVANGAFLYLVPGRAATDYAWSIKPPASAAFLGAGYLAGAVATALVVFAADRWRSLQPLGPALVVLSVLLLGATALHHDRFRFDYPPTWLWIAVYGAAPFAIVVLMRRQRATADVPAADPSLRTLRVLSLVAGAALVAVAAVDYAHPAILADRWPWPLTPLLSRAVASWLAMVGTAQLWCAADLRRRTEAFIPFATLTAWSALLLAIPALHPDDVTRTGAPLAVYLGLTAGLLALGAYGLARSQRSPL